MFIDLSHYFEDNMPGFKMKKKDGTSADYSVHIKPFMTREESLPFYDGKCSFEITQITFQTSVGTYLDSPYHRHEGRRDISEIKIEEVILPGIVIDVRGMGGFEEVSLDAIPEVELTGKAVLFNFAWDVYWGRKEYGAYPYLSEEVINFLVKSGVKLVGVDTANIDSTRKLHRPAHTIFLEKDIFIVENLTGLDKLYGKNFRFFAVPLKAKKVAALSIRAFAEI